MFINFIFPMLLLPLPISCNKGYSDQTEPSQILIHAELKNFEMSEENNTATFEWSDTKREKVLLQQEDDECIYRGSFKEDPSSRVLVTGCEWEERSIQIHSFLYGDTLATRVNGSVELLQEHGNLLMNDIVENDKFLQQLHQKQLGKRIKREYVINPEFRKQFPVSNNANRNLIMPKLLDLPINIYLAPSWRSKFSGLSGGKSKAKQILSHVKEWYLHPSLDTKINIIYVDSNIFSTSADLDPTEDNLKSLESFVSPPPSGYAAIVYLTATTGGSLGIAYTTAICSKNKKIPRSISKWHDSNIHTAQTVAHEIGHNLGYYHDFDTTTYTGRNKPCGPGKWNNGPDNDLMNYASNSKLKQKKWSECSNDDFRNYFAEVTSKPGSTFCLEEERTCSAFMYNTLRSGCPDPTTLDNGRFFCLEDDMTCHVACDPGYYLEIADMAGYSALKAQRFMKCLGNTWTPLPATFQCTLDCEYSGNAQNPACTGQTILIESLGRAAEHHGSRLGYFDRTQENLNGRPVYKQRGEGGFLYHYSGSGEWMVGETLGGDNAGVSVVSMDLVPPSMGWKYWGGGKWQNDKTLTGTSSPANPSSSCTTIQVAATGPAASARSDQMGRYQWEGEWLNGHKLFIGGRDGDQYLRVHTGGSSWTIDDSKDSATAWISSGRGTTCPCQKEAGPSIRYGDDWWEYVDWGEWQVDKTIRVTCE